MTDDYQGWDHGPAVAFFLFNWCNGVLPIVQCCFGSRNFPQFYLFGPID